MAFLSLSGNMGIGLPFNTKSVVGGAPSPLTLDLNFAQPWGSAINDAVVAGPASFLTHTRASAATGFDENGVLQTAASGDPVFDHDPGYYDNPKGILIEEARTNVCTYSEDFSNWSLTGTATVTTNDATAPDGNLTADKIDDTSGADTGYRYRIVTVPNDSSAWAFSVSIAKDTDETRFAAIALRIAGGTAVDSTLHINTKTGAVAEENGAGVFDAFGIIDCGTYWRVWCVNSNNSTGNTSVKIYVYPARATVFGGAVNASTTGFIHAWGAQLENAASPSSYIKTTTASATRVRTQITSIDNSDWLNSDGTGAFTVKASGYPGFLNYTGVYAGYLFFLDVGDDSTSINVDHASSGLVRTIIYTTGNTGSINAGIASESEFCVAVAYKIDDTDIWQNGNLYNTDTTVGSQTGYTQAVLSVGHRDDNTRQLWGWIKELKYYNAVPSDVEMAALTLPDPTLDLNFALDWGSSINDSIQTPGLTSFLTHTRASAATGFDENGVLQTATSGNPVFNHDPANSNAAKGLLIEEARTNICLQSEDFGTTWGGSNLTVTANDTIAPDGNMVADKLNSDTAAANALLQAFSVTDNSTSWVASVMVKAGDSNNFGIRLFTYNGSPSPDGGVFFDLSDQSVNGVWGSPDDYGLIDIGGGWFLAYVVITNNSSGNTGLQCNIYPSATGVFSGSTGYVHAFGAQVENAAYPSSYIKTTSASATRVATDVYGGSNIDWYNNGGPGTIFGNYIVGPYLATKNIILLGESGSGNLVKWYHDLSNTYATFAYDTNSLDAYTIVPVAWDQENKVMFALDTNDSALSFNGSAVNTDTSVNLEFDANINRLNLGHINFGGYMNGHFKGVKYWPSRLANTVLQDLTS